MISHGHSLYWVWRLWDHSFLSYSEEKQTHTDTQTDASERLTPATLVGMSNYICVCVSIKSCFSIHIQIWRRIAERRLVIFVAHVTFDTLQLIQGSGAAREKALSVCLRSQSIRDELCRTVIDHASSVVWLFSLWWDREWEREHACVDGDTGLLSVGRASSRPLPRCCHSSYCSPASTDH